MIHIKIRGRYSATARNNPDKVQVSAIMVGIYFYGLCNLFHLNGIDGSVAELAKALNAMINNGIDAENNAKEDGFHLNIIGIQDKCCTFAQNNKLTTLKMARPIKNTPVLYGKDAERFLADISQLPSIEERTRERARIENSVNDFMGLVAEFKDTKKHGSSKSIYTHQ